MTRIDDLLQRMATLEREIDLELDLVRSTWRYRIEKGRIRFERDVREAHRRLRRSIPRYLRESQILSILTAPVIYAMIIPIAFLDACRGQSAPADPRPSRCPLTDSGR